MVIATLGALLAVPHESTKVVYAATTLVVTKAADTNDGVCDADCSLREAITAATNGDTINIPTGTYTVGTELFIDKDLTLGGAGISSTIIQGAESPSVAGHRVFRIGSGYNVTISSLTIRHGNVPGGGGIDNSGVLALTNTAVSNNFAPGAAGGIFNSGVLTVTNSTVSDNTGSFGGGIYTVGTMTLTNSTISGNTAGFGGGIANFGTMTLTNSTLSGNTSTANAGGVAQLGGTMALTNSTVSGNTAINSGGIFSNTGTTFKNTIIAGNTATNSSPDCSGALTSQGYNLIQDVAGCNIFGDLTGNLAGQDPLLGPLSANGGPTFTHALGSGSAAIDAGNDNDAPVKDQRGISRPQGSQSDIGAFEVQVALEVSFTTQPLEGTAGATFSPPPVVGVHDSFGDTVASSTAAVTLSITPETGTAGATLSGTTTVNAVNGVATFTELSIGALGSDYTLTAASAGLTSTTSSSFNVTAGTPTKLAFTIQPVGAGAGSALNTQPVIAIQDNLGNTVTSSTAAVILSITSGTGTAGAALSGTTTVNAVNGMASFVDLNVNTAGSAYTLTAVSAGLTSTTSSSLNVTAGTPTKLAFTTQPVGAGAESLLNTQPVVAVRDNLGNTVTSSTAAVTLAITPGAGAVGAILSGNTTVNAVDGVATFTGLTIDELGVLYTLTATSPSLASATSSYFSIVAFGAGPALGQAALWGLFGSFVALFILLVWKRERLGNPMEDQVN